MCQLKHSKVIIYTSQMIWNDCDLFRLKNASAQICAALFLSKVCTSTCFCLELNFSKFNVSVYMVDGCGPMVVMLVACVTETLQHFQCGEIYLSNFLYLIFMYFQSQEFSARTWMDKRWPLLQAQVPEIFSRIQRLASLTEFRFA